MFRIEKERNDGHASKFWPPESQPLLGLPGLVLLKHAIVENSSKNSNTNNSNFLNTFYMST